MLNAHENIAQIITGERDFPAVTLCPSTSIIDKNNDNSIPNSAKLNDIVRMKASAFWYTKSLTAG